MKLASLVFALSLLPVVTGAQDEGVITARQRVSKANSIYLVGGAAGPLNTEAYYRGILTEFGYHRSLNPVLVAGVALLFAKPKTDFGNLTLTAIGLSLKVNFVSRLGQARWVPYLSVQPCGGTANDSAPGSTRQSFTGVYLGPGLEHTPQRAAVGLVAQLSYLTTSKMDLRKDALGSVESRSFQAIFFTLGATFKF